MKRRVSIILLTAISAEASMELADLQTITKQGVKSVVSRVQFAASPTHSVADEDEKQRESPTSRSSVRRSSFKQSRLPKPIHLQTTSGAEILVENGLFRMLTDSHPDEVPSIPSAALDYFKALGGQVRFAQDDCFDRQAIESSLATIATEMNATNMYDYLEHARAFRLKGLPVSMLLAKVIDLKKQELKPIEAPPARRSSFFGNSVAVEPPLPNIDVKSIPSEYHAQLAKLYFLEIGRALDFSTSALDQPECFFSVAELYAWKRLSERLPLLNGKPALDLSPFRMGSLKGLEELPYLRKIAIIRISPNMHYHFALTAPSIAPDDDPFCFCCSSNKQEQDIILFEDIILCRFPQEDNNPMYPPNHRFAHIK